MTYAYLPQPKYRNPSSTDTTWVVLMIASWFIFFPAGIVLTIIYYTSIRPQVAESERRIAWINHVMYTDWVWQQQQQQQVRR